jgi:hypothetical protein
MCNGTPQNEYGHVTDHIIHYANARFKQLTLFIALSAGLIGILFSKNGVDDYTVRVALKLLGIVTAMVFWVLEQSSNRWWPVLLRELLSSRKCLDTAASRKNLWRRHAGLMQPVRSDFSTLWLLPAGCPRYASNCNGSQLAVE